MIFECKAESLKRSLRELVSTDNQLVSWQSINYTDYLNLKTKMDGSIATYLIMENKHNKVLFKDCSIKKVGDAKIPVFTFRESVNDLTGTIKVVVTDDYLDIYQIDDNTK